MPPASFAARKHNQFSLPSPLHCRTNQLRAHDNYRAKVVPMFRAGSVSDIVPGLVLIATCYVAALQAFRMVRQSSRGRARSAIAWISGFLIGVIATMFLSVTIGTIANPDAAVSAGGLLGSFLGPFVGILHGKWLGPVRKKRRPADLLQSLPREPSR